MRYILFAGQVDMLIAILLKHVISAHETCTPAHRIRYGLLQRYGSHLKSYANFLSMFRLSVIFVNNFIQPDPHLFPDFKPSLR